MVRLAGARHIWSKRHGYLDSTASGETGRQLSWSVSQVVSSVRDAMQSASEIIEKWLYDGYTAYRDALRAELADKKRKSRKSIEDGEHRAREAAKNVFIPGIPDAALAVRADFTTAAEETVKDLKEVAQFIEDEGLPGSGCPRSRRGGRSRCRCRCPCRSSLRCPRCSRCLLCRSTQPCLRCRWSSPCPAPGPRTRCTRA